MSDSREDDASQFFPRGARPRVGQNYLVRGEAYQCLARYDEDGKWRDAYSGVVISGSVQIICEMPGVGDGFY